jgi:hypothetical protein
VVAMIKQGKLANRAFLHHLILGLLMS